MKLRNNMTSSNISEKIDEARIEVMSLKNIGPVTTDMLIESGIYSKQDLENFGAVNIYTLLKSRGYKLTKVAVYAFEGAIQDVHWNKLPVETMQRLNEELATSK